jgi:hypothetical protein
MANKEVSEINLLCKKKIQKEISAIKRYFSEKFYFSERFSPLTREESRVCYKIVGVSEIILN